MNNRQPVNGRQYIFLIALGVTLIIFQSAWSQPNPVLGASWLGTHDDERVGYIISGLGDLNGDGFDDFCVGNFHTNLDWPDGNTRDAGGVYVILGKGSGLLFSASLEQADATLYGNSLREAVGIDIGRGGDINGDGYNDIIVGATDYLTSGGYAYIMFGEPSFSWGDSVILRNEADASIQGQLPGDALGTSLDIIGDLNNDGFDEFIVSAKNASGILEASGKIYLFRGKASGWTRNMTIDDATSVFIGDVAYRNAGHQAKGVGDVNGDGIPDFAFSGHNDGGLNDGGRVFLIFGRISMNWGSNYSLLNADVIFSGEDPSSYGWAGYQIRGAGDVNKDGIDDLLISDFRHNNLTGKVYLILGKQSGWQDINLSQADASWIGQTADDWAGYSVSSGFDYNNDGYSDFCIGAHFNDDFAEDAGRMHLVYGKSSGFQQDVYLGNVFPILDGETINNLLGHAVDGVGDFNGDGTDDFSVSATYNDEAGHENYGKIYLYLGVKVFDFISGSVQYESGSPLADVNMKVNGSPEFTTDATGDYSIRKQIGGTYTIEPERSALPNPGSGVVTSYDAALIAGNVVGLEELGTLPGNAGDVDGDGSVTMNDAAIIGRYAVGITGGNHQIGEWVFDPPSRTYVSLSSAMDNQDYTALITGDVDGGWSGAAQMGKTDEAPFHYEWVSSTSTEFISLSLFVYGDVPLLSFDVALNYDDNTLAFAGIERSACSLPFQMNSSSGSECVRIGGYHAEGTVPSGQLCNLKFKKRKRSASLDKFHIQRIDLNQWCVAKDEPVHVSHGDESLPTAILLSSSPNPFNATTAVSLQLPEKTDVSLLIYDSRGRMVRNLAQGEFSAGRHSIIWDGQDNSGSIIMSGLYMIRLVTPDAVKSTKVLLIK